MGGKGQVGQGWGAAEENQGDRAQQQQRAARAAIARSERMTSHGEYLQTMEPEKGSILPRRSTQANRLPRPSSPFLLLSSSPSSNIPHKIASSNQKR
ncbi:MAG: hypothetical protein HC824_05580 [Synechococcales cyanobacterium RM1_1_8]|nr:hypothetical protein [Synechococcales cyanobacterium RM1_1_8]